MRPKSIITAFLRRPFLLAVRRRESGLHGNEERASRYAERRRDDSGAPKNVRDEGLVRYDGKDDDEDDENEEASHYLDYENYEGPNEDATYGLKQLSPIGQHPILSRYKGILPEIREVAKDLPWSSIDFFRIGARTDEPQERPVVWIGVENQNTPWPVVASVLRKVRLILDGVSLDDVECEIRVSRVTLLVWPPLFAPVLKEKFPGEVFVKQGMSTTLGQSTTASGDGYGTLCVYLQSGRYRFALTCRHVCLSLDQPIPMSPTSILIALPYHKVHKAAVRKVRRLTLTLGVDPMENSTKAELEKRDRRLNLISKLSKSLGSIKQSPIIGDKIIYPRQKPFSWTRDWCIIELHPKVLPYETPMNAVDLRGRLTDPGELQNRLVHECFKHTAPDGILPLPDVLPERFFGLHDAENEMRDHFMLDSKDNECFVVGKMGARTGLTWGFVSELRSLVKGYRGSDDSLLLPVFGVSAEGAVSFSRRGDSGAAIFDVKGRVVAMLTCGTENGGATDVTYGTPMESLLEDVSYTLETRVGLAAALGREEQAVLVGPSGAWMRRREVSW